MHGACHLHALNEIREWWKFIHCFEYIQHFYTVSVLLLTRINFTVFITSFILMQTIAVEFFICYGIESEHWELRHEISILFRCNCSTADSRFIFLIETNRIDDVYLKLRKLFFFVFGSSICNQSGTNILFSAVLSLFFFLFHLHWI